jgi:NAD(P)H-dependent FMN reductase
MIDINVLLIVGTRARSIDRILAGAASESSFDGITVNVFDNVGLLPRYSETLEDRRAPDPVVALRKAAARADAALVVTSYRGQVPATVHNAIDWLTRPCGQGALHDKPLAVIGDAGTCYSGVWSHQTRDAHGTLGPLVVEPITVATLSDAVRKLVDQTNTDRRRSRV